MNDALHQTSERPTKPLAGQVALVTGAGRGVGAGIARALAHAGAAVAINDIVMPSAASVARDIVDRGGVAAAVVADVSDARDVGEMVATVEDSLGAISILVNNAGVPAGGLQFGPFVESDPEHWNRLIAVNVIGAMNCSRAVLPGMVAASRGRVVSIVSEAGRVGEPNLAAYSGAKSAVIGFNRALAKEVGRHGVTCNCVSLGWTVDNGDEPDPSLVDRALQRYAVPRLGTPADAAAALLWLASPEAGWVTGQTVGVSGGYAMN